MKKITSLLLLVATVTMAQQPTTYSELLYSGQSLTVLNSNSESNIIRVENGLQPIITTFDDRTDFQNAYAAACTETLISETFDGGPGAGAIQACGPVISSAGDGCFGPGVLEEGFTVTVLDPVNETIYIGEGAIGNVTVLVGANTFADVTILSFPGNDVYAVGADIYNNSDPLTTVRLYDQGGVLMETYDLTNAVGTANFYGFISDEVVGHIEIEGANASGELLGGLEFGICNILSINDNLLSQVSIFPNPTSGVLNVKVPASVVVNGAVVYDVLGKNTGLSLVNGTINTGSLANGIYILSLKTSAGTLTQKIVKN